MTHASENHGRPKSNIHRCLSNDSFKVVKSYSTRKSLLEFVSNMCMSRLCVGPRVVLVEDFGVYIKAPRGSQMRQGKAGKFRHDIALWSIT